jgi:hypothetical protein
VVPLLKSLETRSSDANYLILILAHFDIPCVFQGVQDRLYVGTPFFGEVTIERVPSLRTIPFEMFQYLALKTTLPLIFPLIFVAVVGHEKNYLLLRNRTSKMLLQMPGLFKAVGGVVEQMPT